jgi:dTDP-glucose 4,6-dehydratase
LKSILVTGGSGFIGSNLVEYLLEKYPDKTIVNYSRHTYAMNPKVTEHLENNERYKFIAGDVTNAMLLSNVIKENDVELIFHLASSTHVDRSFLYPDEFLRSNLIGTFTILEVLRHIDIENRPKLVYMSTDEVFGDVPPPHKCKEDEPLAPRNPYSASKASAEMYCNAYFHSFKVPVIIARSMNNFGPRQHPEKLIAKIITRCLKNEEFTLYKGGSVRGWIYVKDTCSALDTIATKGNLGEVYHIPPNIYLTVPEVCFKILKLMNKEHLFKGFKGHRLKDDERYALNGSKMLNVLNWKPNVSFEEGLKETIKWYEQNRWFWEHVYSP